MLLLEDYCILWACLMGIQPADSAGRRVKQCCILFAAARHWLVCRTKRYKYSLSKGLVPLYKRHRVTECVLIGIFRVAQ